MSRLLPRPRHPMLHAADSLVVNVAVTAVLGFAFWVAAARLVPAHELGRDAALLAALMTLSAVCQLNLTTVMLRFLPVTRVPAGRAIAVAYAAVTGLSLVAGTAFVLAAPGVSERFAFLGESAWMAAGFVGAVAAWGVFTLQDAVLTALGRPGWVPLENLVFGVLKIALLPVLAASDHSVFMAWAVAAAVLVVPVNVLTFRAVVPALRARPERSPVERFGRRGLLRFSLGDLGGTLFGHAGSTMLPVLVAAFVASSDTAYFFIPFTIVAAFDLVFLNVASALTVQGATEESALARHARAVARRFSPLLLAGVAGGVLCAPIVLAAYGAGYAEHGTHVLQILLLASLFRALVFLYVAVCRVRGRGGRILAVQASTCLLVLGLTTVLAPTIGITGVACAWLIANVLVAAGTVPQLAELLRTPSPKPRGAAPCAISA